MSKLVETYGPLIEHGILEDGTAYESRGEANPIVYVYRKVGTVFVEKPAQLGNLTARQVAELIATELPR